MRTLRAADRFVTCAAGIRTEHCFSYGAHFDPGNVAFGALLVCNDEQLERGCGYALHPHREAEIVTWVVTGTLTHEDSSGRRFELPAGGVQRLSAGSGIRHSERNRSADVVRFVQMWLRPDVAETEPTYECDVPRLRPGTWTDVVGGAASLGLGTAGAVLRVMQAAAGERLSLPPAPRSHLFVVDGSLDLQGGGSLARGDSLRLLGEELPMRVRKEAHLLVWELPDPQAVAR